MAVDVVRVGTGVLGTGEVAPYGCVHLLAFSWVGESRTEGITIRKVGDCHPLRQWAP